MEYNTQTVAHEPSVEVVAGVGHSMVGGIGTHMVLWALLRDSAMRLRS
jgi:tetrahydromethanopterin S-methyltransferase subunit D